MELLLVDKRVMIIRVDGLLFVSFTDFLYAHSLCKPQNDLATKDDTVSLWYLFIMILTYWGLLIVTGGSYGWSQDKKISKTEIRGWRRGLFSLLIGRGGIDNNLSYVEWLFYLLFPILEKDRDTMMSLLAVPIALMCLSIVVLLIVVYFVVKR